MRSLSAPLLTALLVLAAGSARAQTVSVFGTLSNFDVINDTGQPTEGFEIELDGLQKGDTTYLFGGTYNRYGAPVVVPTAQGLVVRYVAPYDAAAQRFTTATPVATNFTTATGHLCWSGALGMAPYLASGCEHFGVGVTVTPTRTVYRWLVADPANPGSVMPLGSVATIPAPVWVAPPPVNNALPVVEAHLPPPEPAFPAFQFGVPQWVRVFKTELPRPVGLNELMSDNPVVPQDPAQIETGYSLLQSNPRRADRGALHSGGPLSSGSRAVVRRWELYKYTGRTDPLTGEALCLSLGCKIADPSEIGDYVGAQMGAANVGVPSVTVLRAGSGTVNGAGGKINCGGTCTTPLAQGSSVTLTAQPASNAVFTGWSDACAGQGPSCALTVNDQISTTATFTPIFGLSIGRGGAGTVTGSPAGVLNTQISCGSSCSAKFTQGSQVVLTATPAAGLTFVNWTGACSGTAPTCTVWINANLSAQANFK